MSPPLTATPPPAPIETYAVFEATKPVIDVDFEYAPPPDPPLLVIPPAPAPNQPNTQGSQTI